MRAGAVLARMAALPDSDVHAICGPGGILVLAPHPDDESLGCGGLIAQATSAGIPVHVAVLTDGSQSHPHTRTDLVACREREVAAAVAMLGVAPGRLWFMGYPDTAAPRHGRPLRAAAAQLAGLARAAGVATIFAPWQHDPHCDHLAAHRIAARAARLTGMRHISYPVWGWTLPVTHRLPVTAVNGWRLNICEQLALKQAAIAVHRSQMTPLIADDPAGFRLPDGLLAICARPFEVYLKLDEGVA